MLGGFLAQIDSATGLDATLERSLDLVGVFFFAVSGGLVAVRKGFELVGVVALSLVTALGGGVIRDVVLGATPPTAFGDVLYLVVPLVAAAIVFVAHGPIDRAVRPAGSVVRRRRARPVRCHGRREGLRVRGQRRRGSAHRCDQCGRRRHHRATPSPNNPTAALPSRQPAVRHSGSGQGDGDHQSLGAMGSSSAASGSASLRRCSLIRVASLRFGWRAPSRSPRAASIRRPGDSFRMNVGDEWSRGLCPGLGGFGSSGGSVEIAVALEVCGDHSCLRCPECVRRVERAGLPALVAHDVEPSGWGRRSRCERDNAGVGSTCPLREVHNEEEVQDDGLRRNSGSHRPFDDVVAATKAALADHGFGVLTEIDMQQTLKAKIDKEMDHYVDSRHATRSLASAALDVEPHVGVLLPCNVVFARSTTRSRRRARPGADGLDDEPRRIGTDRRRCPPADR